MEAATVRDRDLHSHWRNGRRIESSWRFVEAELLRLIRVAEA